MAAYREVRTISTEGLRSLCIENDWYTRGTAEEYENLLVNLGSSKENLTTEDIIAIAEDIMEHSVPDGRDVTGVAFEVARRMHTFFEEV